MKIVVITVLLFSCMVGIAFPADKRENENIGLLNIQQRPIGFSPREYKQSIQTYERLFSQAQKEFGANDKRTLAIMRKLSESYVAMERYSDGLQLTESLIHAAKATYGADSREVCAFMNDLAKIKLETGESKEAFEILSRIFPILSRSPIDEERIRFHQNCSTYYRDVSIPNLAATGERMIQSMQQTMYGANSPQQICTLINMANDYKDMLNNEYALELSQQALMLSNSIYGNFHPVTADAMITLADVCINLGNYDEALMLLKNATNISKVSLGVTHCQTLRAMNLMARVYMAAGDMESAKKISLQGLDVMHQKSTISRQDRMNQTAYMANLIQIYKNIGEHDLQRKMAQNLLDATKRYYGYGETDSRVIRATEYLAEACYDTGHYQTALYWGNETFKLLSNHRNTKFFGNDGMFINADNSIISSDNIYISNPEKIMARSYYALGKIEESLPYYREFLEKTEHARTRYGTFLSDERKSKWFSQNIISYKEAAVAFTHAKKYDKAFHTLELCKARSLAERYNDQIAESDNMFNQEDAKKFKEFRARFDLLSKQINVAENQNDVMKRISAERKRSFLISEYTQFKTGLTEKYPQYASMNELQNVDEKKNALSLPPESCYISFSFADGQIICFVATRDKLLQINIDEADEPTVAQQCGIYRELLSYQTLKAMIEDGKYIWQLANGEYRITERRQMPERGANLINKPEDFQQLRQKLSISLGNILIKPLVSNVVVSSKRHWIFSTDNELSNIPMETLAYSGKQAIEYADISYVPSLTMLALMSAHKEKNSSKQERKEMFAMGDAIYGNEGSETFRGSRKISSLLRGKAPSISDFSGLQWSNLPGTEKELDNVSAIFDDCKICRRHDASEYYLKSANQSGDLFQYKYFLFATHGIFIPEAPELSSIVLSQGKKTEEDDGYVTVGEWMSYHLNSDLVYLSACESGLGEYQSGEGVIGIPYALCVAGNRDTVMSLWKVDDEIASNFSTSFFKKLKAGNTPVEAINAVKREFMKSSDVKSRSPSAWSAFLLYGI